MWFLFLEFVGIKDVRDVYDEEKRELRQLF